MLGQGGVLIGQPNDEPSGGDRRRLMVDTGLAMLVLIVVGTAITANVGTESTEPGPAAYAFGALLGSLMFVRRRWPVATLLITAGALLVYYMLSYPPVGLAAPVAAALYSAAEQGRIRWSIGTAVALLALSTVTRLAEGDDVAYVLGLEFAMSAGLMAAVVALGDSVRSRRGWRAELDKQAHAAVLEREREAARRVEEERLRIARDLHDLLAHTVSVISLHADVAREALHDEPATAERSLAAVRGACGDVVGELRATLRALRAGDGDDAADENRAPVAGLAQLDGLVEHATAAGLDVRVRRTGVRAELPAIADATAYRLVQESLSNVQRHAGARTVVIELEHGEDALRVRVCDDGRGAAESDLTDPDGGWGIIGMRERLTLLGGSLRTTSRRGEGFVVEACVPLNGQA
ncbi:sensor histidine kinase [Qaidamihabitans albus]|uniref:sensor histidine kinase n=1 Tax=Qaidamihabitans albus TaxID=2795733 RepID=UPI001F455627|nr:sensor histidine kinase [Qaidamihabitans albus]